MHDAVPETARGVANFLADRVRLVQVVMQQPEAAVTSASHPVVDDLARGESLVQVQAGQGFGQLVVRLAGTQGGLVLVGQQLGQASRVGGAIGGHGVWGF